MEPTTDRSKLNGFVLSWTYDLADYQDRVRRFRSGSRSGGLKRLPKLMQMWVATERAAAELQAEFMAAHPRGGISVEPGIPPKRQSTMFLNARLTSVTTTELFGEASP